MCLDFMNPSCKVVLYCASSCKGDLYFPIGPPQSAAEVVKDISKAADKMDTLVSESKEIGNI